MRSVVLLAVLACLHRHCTRSVFERHDDTSSVPDYVYIRAPRRGPHPLFPSFRYSSSMRQHLRIWRLIISGSVSRRKYEHCPLRTENSAGDTLLYVKMDPSLAKKKEILSWRGISVSLPCRNCLLAEKS